MAAPLHAPSDRILAAEADGVTVHGHCDPRFQGVLDAFVENFTRHGELGASVAVEVEGEPVVDLWGGWADDARQRPWGEDTITVVFSNTKPATALCAHLLVQAGELDLERPLRHYWPAFGDSARRETTARMLLDHRAGLPALREKLPRNAAFDWDLMVERLEREPPFWAPGIRVGYHGLTFGWLVGELVRRLSGQSLGAFFRERVAAPLDLDFWIGLPEAQESRVAEIVPPELAAAPRNRFEAAVAGEPDSIAALYYRNTGGWRPAGFNSRAGHAAELGAAGGISNARSLARLFGTLAMDGRRGGLELIRPEVLARATAESSVTDEDVCLRVPTRFAAGFMRSMDNRAQGLDSAVLGEDAFGHVGAGGSLAFATPRHRLGFGYVMNRMGPGVLLNPRGEGLVRAVYGALGERP